MNHWAIELCPDGNAYDVDPAHACTATRAPFSWVHLDGNAAETADWLREHGKLPPTVAYALTAAETRPRCEAIDDGALVNLRGLREGEDPDDDALVSIRAWAEARRAVTVSFRPLAGLPEIREVMQAGKIKDAGDLISQLAMRITKRLDPVIADLGDVVDECETALDPDQAFETRRRIAGARVDAIAYRRFVVPEREALTRMADLEVDWLEPDDRLHLREAADRFARMGEELESIRERAALIHEQLTDLRAEQIDRRSLLLAVVALLFLPTTFITGLFGMNVEGFPFSKEPWSFAAVCGICAAIAVAIGAWFATKHWFRR